MAADLEQPETQLTQPANAAIAKAQRLGSGIRSRFWCKSVSVCARIQKRHIHIYIYIDIDTYIYIYTCMCVC